jgi:methionine-rich copper-binding protein CopC
MTRPHLLRISVGLLVAATLLVGGIVWAPPASADDLIEAEPHPGATIAEEPEVILLRFDRDLALQKGAHAVEVLNAAGESVGGESEISGYSRRTMIVHLAEPVEEGEVSVRYRVRFAGSDETVEGAFDFAIEPGFEGDEIEEVALGEPRSEQSIVLWTIAILLAITVFALLLYFLRVVTDNAQSSLQPPDDAHH